MALIDKNTDHAERFSRPMLWVRRGWEKRKTTALRRLELRRARRVRGVEVRELASVATSCYGPSVIGAIECERNELEPEWGCPDDDVDYFDFDITDLDIDRADSERSGFRVTIGDFNAAR